MKEDIKTSLVIVVLLMVVIFASIYAVLWHTAACERFKSGMLGVGAAPARCLE